MSYAQTSTTRPRRKRGRPARGSEVGTARLTEADVEQIRRLYALHRTPQQQLAAEFGVAQSTIALLLRGRTWRHLGGVLPPQPRRRGEQHHSARLREVDVIAIRIRYARGETQPQLARAYGVSRYLVGRVVRRQAWAHVD